MDLERLPPPRQNNLWHHYRHGQTVVVFVHGVLSDSRSCWFHDDPRDPSRSRYWPELVRRDPRLGEPSIFLGGYYTAIDAGPYEIRNCADELYEAMRRPDIAGRTPVLDHGRVVFVCHSTGGIVVRYLLDKYYHQLAAKKVGLVLIASPSYGSKLANKLDLIARIYRHSVGAQLQWGSWSLQDLDARFKDLVHQRRIPDLLGVEAYENHFIVHRKWLPPKTYVVDEESAGRYFGAPRLLRQTDHFTAVKPDSINHPAHELLVDFFTNSFGVSAALTAATPGNREAHGAAAPPVRQVQRSTPASSEPADAGLEIVARDYQLVETLYRGHYSVVRRCVSKATGEACIVKQTDTALVSIPALTALQQMASLHIVRPRRIWSDAGLVFEELEIVDGVLLSDIIAREVGGLSGSLLECCHDDLLGALRDLRAAGLVYRDIHPDNLFLVRQPRPPVLSQTWREFVTEANWNHLLDASLTFPDEETLAANLGWIPRWMLVDSTFVALADDHSRPPVVHGTVTPEEQVNGRPVFASDMYALGATLYFGITGFHVPSYTSRRTGEPLQSLENAVHPSVRFQRYLTETLALTPAERPGLDYELPESTVVNAFCGVLRLSEDAFLLCSTVDTSNHIVNGRQLLAFLGTRQATSIPYKDYWRSVAETLAAPS